MKNQLFVLTTPLKGVSLSSSDLLAIDLLKKSGLNLLDAARICISLVESSGGEKNMVKLHKLIDIACQVHQELSQSVSFREALATTLEQKKHRSPRTLQDIRQTMNALMRFDPALADKPIRSITSSDCLQLLHGAYSHSATRFSKARANLSVVFSVAYQRGWCKENPVRRVSCPVIRERVIEPMPIAQLEKLFSTAQQPKYNDCLPALTLMVYTGVRPDEIRRLEWKDIDWEEKMLYMNTRHTKTGGGRHIPLPSKLIGMLRRYKNKNKVVQAEKKLCPPNWQHRWRALRDAAGFSTWVPDILRHSFASYHAKKYKNLPELQLIMGHRDCQLLLTRYINLRGITKKSAQQFWQGFSIE